MNRNHILTKTIPILLILICLIIPSYSFSDMETASDYSDQKHPFSIVWLSDTQEYASTYPDIYFSMMHYIAEVRDERNIVYVVHTGDQINDAYKGEDIQRADEAFQLLPEDLPVFTACGNHDYK